MRRIIAGVLGTLFVLSVTHAYIVRAAMLRQVDYVNVVPPAHLQQVAMVRKHVPAGSTVLYLDNEVDAWNMGMFQRTLYPQLVVLPATSADRVGVVRAERAPSVHPVRAAIITRRYHGSREGFAAIIPLPDNPQGIPIDLGVWPDGVRR